MEYQWSAREIAAELDVTPSLVWRALHDHGIPVRTTRRHLDSCKLLDMLYDDESVLPCSLATPFPYETSPEASPIGFRPARHIELLTGQPADQILDFLHASNIPVRTNHGMSPRLSAVMSAS